MSDSATPPRRPYLDADIDGAKAIVLAFLLAVLAAGFWFMPAA
jgi:hypothetical protein